MSEGSPSGVGAQMPELSRAASIFSEAVCCLITRCWSHLPQTLGFKLVGQGHNIVANMAYIRLRWKNAMCTCIVFE